MAASKQFIIQREKFVDIQRELPKLFNAQYNEVVIDKDNLEVNVDFKRYVKLEELNVLHCLTVRYRKRLIGYFFNMVVYSLQHKGLIISASDLLYVAPQYRKGTGVGIELLRAGILAMKKIGVKKMYVTAKRGTGLSVVLKRFKFRHIEEVHSLYIGE